MFRNANVPAAAVAEKSAKLFAASLHLTIFDDPAIYTFGLFALSRQMPHCNTVPAPCAPLSVIEPAPVMKYRCVPDTKACASLDGVPGIGHAATMSPAGETVAIPRVIDTCPGTLTGSIEWPCQ